MKCEVARDLLTLYVDDLCSPETRKEVEMHLKECDECGKKLEHYRKELKTAQSVVAETEITEIEPMKKVKKKMKKSKGKVIALSIILLLVLGNLGILCFGEATNLCPGFTTISDVIKIKAACDDLAKGKTEKFMELMAFRLEDRYILRATGAFEDEEEYKAAVLENMNAAYECYFKGKEIDVKLSDIGVFPYKERMSADDYTSYISVKFYEGDTMVRCMEFTKVSKDYFTVYEDIGKSTDDPLLPSFTDGIIPYDDIIYKIAMPYATQSNYKKLINGETQRMGSGLELIIEKPGEEENEKFSNQIREKMENLMQRGCYIKNTSYSLTDYDENIGKWIYKVWITYEDQHSGCVFVTEQNFISHNNSLYVIEDDAPVVSSVSSEEGAVSLETVEIALNMFR